MKVLYYADNCSLLPCINAGKILDLVPFRIVIPAEHFCKRFVNEEIDYKIIGDILLEQTDHVGFQILDNKIREAALATGTGTARAMLRPKAEALLVEDDTIEVVERVEEIQIAARRSLTALEEIKGSIDSITQAAGQVSTACQQASSAASELGQAITELASTAEEIAAQAGRHRHRVRRGFAARGARSVGRVAPLLLKHAHCG